ncbi:TPA: hypothetical protein ACUUDJ_003478 [Pseudomonas aeruginosa]|uniref:hypothetical protein n=1 Tax=Pseudomonas aeruginosa TaxID=287 RepID=UPI00298FBEF9|nr:hypothetical protein [Pseudomonas aeruginosa]MDW8830572.1 hypothetical protein [Pseudomonas aeruginosa]HBO6815021.1 hypothetical protein [Pseudomonas aeruginosa]
MSEAKWQEAQKVAREFSTQSVLYCVRFSHGLMKVGRTKNMRTRLNALTAHGVVTPLIEELIVQPVEGCAADAERLAINSFSAMTKQHGPEVFSCLTACVIRKVLANAAIEAKDARAPVGSSDESFDVMARSSNMYAALIHMAVDRARSCGMHERANELEEIIKSAPPGALNEIARSLCHQAA